MDPEAEVAVDWRVRLGARALARDIEVNLRRTEAKSRAQLDHIDLLSPGDLRDPDSGRRALSPSPTLALVGRYFRRARRLALKTQQQVADESGASQSMVSRAERGLAPGMGFERFVLMCQPLGGLFPLGACPHDHDCPWQPVKPPERQLTDATRFLEYLLKTAGER